MPGHRVQIDVKFIQPLAGAPKPKQYYQFTAIDDCTRLRMLRIYLRCDQKLSPVVALHALLAVVLLAGPLLNAIPYSEPVTPH